MPRALATFLILGSCAFAAAPPQPDAPGNIKAWLKQQQNQYIQEQSNMLFLRGNPAALKNSVQKAEKICSDVLERAKDPATRADWFERRAVIRDFAAPVFPEYRAKALEDFDAAVELDPRNPKTYQERAEFLCPVAERCEGQSLEKAAEDLEKAAALTPGHYYYPWCLGRLYRDNGVAQKAKHWLGLALERAKSPKDRELVQKDMAALK